MGLEKNKTTSSAKRSMYNCNCSKFTPLFMSSCRCVSILSKNTEKRKGDINNPTSQVYRSDSLSDYLTVDYQTIDQLTIDYRYIDNLKIDYRFIDELTIDYQYR